MTAAESKMPSSKPITRKQRFKDLMRHRTTLAQGLTLRQIYCELHPAEVEKYTYRNPDLGRSELIFTAVIFSDLLRRIVDIVKLDI